MTYIPVVKVYDVDYSFIIKNYLNRELWDKEWTLFVYKDFVFTLSLYNINTKDKIINFNVKLGCDKDMYIRSVTRTLPYQLEGMTIDQFKSLINNCMGNLINDLEERCITQLDEEYKRIDSSRDEQQEMLRDIAKDFLDSEGVTNEDIRDAYIDRYVDKNDDIWEKLQDYKNSMQYKVLTELYLIFAKSTENENLEKKVLNNQTTDISELLEEISDFILYTKTDDYYNEVYDKLPSIA